MDPTQVRTLSIAELESRIEDTREELFKLRFQAESGEVADTSRLREARRDLARMLTILRERELWSATEIGGRHSDE